MKALKRLLPCLAFALLAISGLHAQTRSISVQIVAIVPTILKLSLDFGAGAVAQVSGYLSRDDDVGSASQAKAALFEIRDNAVIELGGARIFSNTPQAYSVDVFSTNGCALHSDSGSDDSNIPYSLTLDGRPGKLRDGAFSFQTGGKTSMDGSAHKVALAIAKVPASSSGGFYSDQLLFALSAN
jgi:hypothetical protein